MRPLALFFLLAALPAHTHAARAFVKGTVARLRQAPTAEARVIAILRIGEPIEVRSRRGSWARVEALSDEVHAQPATGWLKRSLLTERRPTLKAALARADAADTIAGRRRWLERAAALAPGDEAVIAKLIAVLEEAGDERWHHMAKKGLVAATKRNASWDGPLYPTIDAVTTIPRPCLAGDPPPSGAQRAPLETEALRARAFEIVDSGKVVSVTTLGYQTQLLDTRVCLESPCGPRLGYVLPRKASSGALVPSWMVAGHRVTGYAPAAPAAIEAALPGLSPCEGCRAFLDRAARSAVFIDGPRWRLAWRTLAGVQVSGWLEGEAPYPAARPIARFDDRPETFRLLWLATAGGAGTCPAGHEAWLVRLSFDAAGALAQTQEGRRFSAALP